MKKFAILCLALLGILINSQAQKSNVGDSKWSFGIGMEALDLFTPELKEYSTFSKPLNFGLKMQAWYNMNKSVAIPISVSSPSFRRYQNEVLGTSHNRNYLILSTGFIYKFNNGYMLKETTPVAPYMFMQGAMHFGLSAENDYAMGFNFPVGLGLNFRIVEDVAFNLSGGYSFAASKQTQSNLFYNAGFMVDLGGNPKEEKKEEPVVEVVPEPVDSDGDGIPDMDDDCPYGFGLAEFNGCPDTDGDGIPDNQDKCPELAGLAEFGGCPDTDGDGIPDYEDECPEEFGVARLNGCPEPDKDGDGVIDSEDDCPDVAGLVQLKGCPDTDGDGTPDHLDKCPTEPGPKSNKGCPEIKTEVKQRLDFVANAIQFETGSSLIKTSSYKLLDEVAQILKEWPNYHVSVEGHTDNVGSAESNLVLSEKRAAAAATYLINKGIDAKRVKSSGFGLTKPIADNKTAEGRSKNRRVEFNLYIPD